MKLELTHGEILNIHGTLANLRVTKASAKTKYAISKNVETLEKFVKSIQKAVEMPENETLKAFEQGRADLLREYAITADGKPNVREDAQGRIQRVVPMAKQSDYVLALEALNDHHPDLQDVIQAHNEEVTAFLELSETVDGLRTIPEIPDELTQQQSNILFKLFADPDAPSNKEPLKAVPDKIVPIK